MFYKVILTFLTLALYVHAQAPPSTGNIPPCVLTCSANAATSSGCQSFSNVTCVCTSQAFQTAAAMCIQSTCTPADQQAALAIQSATCKNASGSPSGASTGAPAASSAGGSTPAASSGASPAASGASGAPSPAASGNSTAAGSGASPAASSPAASKSAGLKVWDVSMGHVLGLFAVLVGMAGGVGTLF